MTSADTLYEVHVAGELMHHSYDLADAQRWALANSQVLQRLRIDGIKKWSGKPSPVSTWDYDHEVAAWIFRS